MRTLTLITTFSFLLITNIHANHPNDGGVNPTKNYTDAYEALKAMLEGQTKLSFRDAVFITENAWHDDSLSYGAYMLELLRMVQDVNTLRENLSFNYPHSDKYNVYTNAALFQYFTDTIGYGTSDSVFGYKYPFTYTSDDPLVEKDWTTMFVTKLMETNQGNCHSLPYLYRILAHEFQVSANLAIAPNHIYITHLCHDPKVTWYNTELTSGTHPTDSWISIKTYMSMEGIRNGIYGLPLNEKQSVALCLVDLANGYLRKFPERDHQFVVRCLNTALDHFPTCINALLLKLDVLSKSYQKNRDENLVAEMDKTARIIHELGYDEMPHQMYEDWLTGAKDTIKEHRPYKNVNQEIGYTSLDNGKPVLTASGGRYLEGHWTDSLEQIGNVLYDTKHKRVAQFLPIDTSDIVSRTPKDLPCRWLSPDPLTSKYPDMSPYHFVGGNPIKNIEIDGRYFVGVDGKEVTYKIENGQIVLSKNASKDLIKLANSISKSGLEYPSPFGEKETTAFTQFKALAENKTKINFGFSKKKKGFGNLLGYHQPHDKNGKALKYKGKGGMGKLKGMPSVLEDEETGELYYEEVTITLYEKNILDWTGGLKSIKGVPFTIFDGYSIVFTHEAEHDLDQEGIKTLIGRSNGEEDNYDIEIKPMRKELDAMDEIEMIKDNPTNKENNEKND